MRPANTEITEGAPPASAAATSRTWSSVQIAVTFSFTPAAASSRIRSVDGAPRVLVTGTFT